ncbi:MAG: D-alanyl-D-alanine-carboxypeptidase/endopeptidase AmpH, partial [Enterobacterales bacterium]|nr:D-alanyl-D-alanine-carboxypeptidase/endopeptidase AmpH [Enterobacterales bacterium]
MDKRVLKFFPATLLGVACAVVPLTSYAQQPQPLASQVVDGYAEHIFYNSGAAAMAMVAIDNNQQVFRSFGETRPGNDTRPR